MDPLSDILTLMKPAGYGFRGLDAGGDWALHFAWAPGIRCFAIEVGNCWLRLASSEPVPLAADDVVLLSGGEPVLLYTSDAVHPLDAHDVFASVPPGEVAVLNGGGEVRGMGGFFGLEGVQTGALLAAVPPMIHVRSDTSRAALRSGVQRLMRELSEPQPGGALLASHLAQALLVEALRAHLAEGSEQRGWLAGLVHPAIRRALAAMHADVRRRWSLADLAREAGLSRSSFAAQFERVTGETPIAYLTRWRMAIAADRLATTSMTLTAIAASVGYDSDSAFGAAFKRFAGHSPRRARVAAFS